MKLYNVMDAADAAVLNEPGRVMYLQGASHDLAYVKWCASYSGKSLVVVEVSSVGKVLCVVDGERPAEPGPAPTEKEMHNHAKAHPDKDGDGAWVVAGDREGAPLMYFRGEGDTAAGNNRVDKDATWLAIDQRGMPVTVKRW